MSWFGPEPSAKAVDGEKEAPGGAGWAALQRKKRPPVATLACCFLWGKRKVLA